MKEILSEMNIAKAIYLICAFVPLVIFIAAYKMKRSETVAFAIGTAANTGAFFACLFSAIILAAFDVPVLEIICLALVILIPGFLYYSILSKYISEAKIAVSFSLGLSQASMLFWIFAVNLSADDLIWREQEGHYYISDHNKLYISFIIIAAVKVILTVLSALIIKKIYSSEKFKPEIKAALSSVIMLLCGVCADLLLVVIT